MKTWAQNRDTELGYYSQDGAHTLGHHAMDTRQLMRQFSFDRNHFTSIKFNVQTYTFSESVM